MRNLSFHEVQSVSGAQDVHSFSNAFLSGMKGESLAYGANVIGYGAIVGLPMAIAGTAIGPAGFLIGGAIGASVGGTIGLMLAYNEYLLGQNYVEAQKLIKP